MRYDRSSFSKIIKMTAGSNGKPSIIRTERGLIILETRITLYDVMDYLKANYSPKLIRDWLNLSEEQLDAALCYIDTHRGEVETEYQIVLQTAQEIREYWEAQNQERFAKIAAMPAKRGQEAIRAKLQEWKAKINLR